MSSAAESAAPLRTVHINTARGWRGGEQQSFYLVRGLLQRGHAAEAVAQPSEEYARRLEAAGVRVHPVRMRGEWDLWAARRIRRLLTDGGYDVCHMHTAHAHMLGGLASLLLPRRPAMIVSRRVDFSLHKMPLGLSRLKYLFGADRFITTSEFIRQVMIRDGVAAGRIVTVHSCQDPARFEDVEAGGLRAELGLPPGARVLGNVSALVDHKGQCYLLDAMPRILAETPDVVLVVVGEGELRGRLEAQARRLGIVDRVRFAGHRNDVLRFYAVFDVFVMSSKMEGVGGAMLEAMGMGCPVVTTNAGGMPEVVRDGVNGLVVERCDPVALAEGVLRMLRDSELRHRCAAEGRRTLVERFSTTRLVEGTLAVYREALAGRGPSAGRPEAPLHC
jgi:glycosyltransferase involved in cell wall biosynthesis